MTVRLLLLATMAAGFLLLGTGCSNKASSERTSLINQNDELKRELDAEKAARSSAEARASAVTAQATVLPAPSETSIRTPSMDPSGKPLDLSKSGSAKSGARPSTPSASGSTGIRAGSGSEVIVDVLEIPGDVLFDSGKATLKPASLKTLDGIVATLKSKYAGKTIRVEGHTDPTPIKSGTWDNNYDLAAARATAVLKYLVKKGIPEKDMYIVSFGSNNPKSKTNLALDRRVDIVIVDAAGSK